MTVTHIHPDNQHPLLWQSTICILVHHLVGEPPDQWGRCCYHFRTEQNVAHVVRDLFESHIATTWQNWEQNPVLLTPYIPPLLYKVIITQSGIILGGEQGRYPTRISLKDINIIQNIHLPIDLPIHPNIHLSSPHPFTHSSIHLCFYPHSAICLPKYPSIH